MKNSIHKISSTAFILAILLGGCEKDEAVKVKPVAGFKVNEEIIVQGEAAVFTDISFDEDGTIVSWSWDFGNGESSTEQSPSYVYPAIGEFTVKLTVTDNDGQTNANEFSKNIAVIEPSTVSIKPTVLWSFTLPAKFEASSPAVADDGMVYLGCRAKNGDANVFAVKNGAEVWKYATEDIVRSAPAIADNGNIYIGSYDDNLYGFTPAGAVAVEFDMGDNAKYSSPVFGTDGTIYIGSQTDELIAVDPAGGGTEKWRFDTGGNVDGVAAIGADGTIFIGSTGDFFHAFNPDGTEKWKSEYGTWTATATAIGPDGTVYFAGEGNNMDATVNGVFIAYNPVDGTEKWRVGLTEKVNHGGPAVAPDGTIYLGGHDNQMVAYNTDGTEKWTYPANGAIQGVPAIDNDGNIYFTDVSGYLHVIDSEGNKKWKEIQLGSKIWSSPAIGMDGTIYISADQEDGTGKLYALKTKATGLASGGWPMLSKNAKHTGR